MERTHLTLTVHGVGCASSAHVVERRLGQVAGVMEAYVNPVFRVAPIEYDAERCSAEDPVAAIESLGYARDRKSVV